MVSSKDDSCFYLFGTPRFIKGREEIHFHRLKMYALLTYLAFSKHQFHRDVIADLLWPESDLSHSRSSLRVVLSDLHKIIDPVTLPVTRDIVGPLDLNRLYIDIEEFQSAAARFRMSRRTGNLKFSDSPVSETELLEKAVSLYRDDFMSGFSLKNCPQFSDWQFQQRDHLQREMRYCLKNLADLYERTGEFEKSISICLRLVSMDNLNEDAHCALMRLYAYSGQKNAAISQYRKCEKILHEEIGLCPEESTVSLFESIRENRLIEKRIAETKWPVVPRIAILPFNRLAPDQDWLSDGIANALAAELSRMSGLEVISNSSSKYLWLHKKSSKQIASMLNVGYLLEGSAERAENYVEIKARLIEASGERLLWSDTYNGNFDSLSEIQDRISRVIAEQVCGTLMPGPFNGRTNHSVSEAHEACMLGDFYLRKSQGEEEIDRARGYYMEAIGKDPSCADAYAGLAFTYFALGGYGKDSVPTSEVQKTVGRYIQKALNIDPRNVLARMVLAGSLAEWDKNWERAEREYKEILRINPRHIETLCWYSELKMCFGRFDEVLELVEKAYHFNPLDISTLVHQYRYYCYVLKYRRSLEILNKMDKLFPRRIHTSFLRAKVYLLTGQLETAFKHCERAWAMRTDYDLYRGYMAYICGKRGMKEKAFKMIDEMILDRSESGQVQAFWIAFAYHGAGMNDKAIQWLEKASENNEIHIRLLAVQPLWGELHWDSRFQNIIRSLGLPLQLDFIESAIKIQNEGSSVSIP